MYVKDVHFPSPFALSILFYLFHLMKQVYIVLQVRIERARTFVLFRTDPYQPVLVPFIFRVLQLKSIAKETIKKKLYAIKSLYEYFQLELGYDLDEILINSRYQILKAELPSFIKWLLYTESIAGFHTRKATLQHISEYLYWALKRYSKTSNEANNTKEFLDSHYRSLPTPGPVKKDFITQGEVNLLLTYTYPLSTDNPFKEKNRLRNYIIIHLFASTGIRIGELLKLKSSDVHDYNGSYYIEVLNREDEEEDLRADEPSLKNEQSQRVISITEELHNCIQKYIMNFRRPIRDGRKVKLGHGYLLVSERGTPLSKTTIYDVLDHLKETIIRKGKHKFEKDLTPHSFRHYFAESFLENLIEIQGVDEERAKDQLRIIGGWSLSSNMPSFYAKRYIAESANAHNAFRIQNAIKKLHD